MTGDFMQREARRVGEYAAEEEKTSLLELFHPPRCIFVLDKPWSR
ncbi:hypothetical protein [Paraburkholderia dilworthii]|nr:hypothetical protein [Paraburkholderia dilworthii]